MDIEINTNDNPIEVETSKAGPQGLSAYQVAVKNGFIGTEQEWLDSLVGETGATGSPGSPGPAGQDGVDGYSPIANVSKIDTTATITITDKNGTTTATISDGANGVDGQDGIGIPSGGTTGQILAKVNNTDYNTEWINLPSPDMSNYYTKTDIDEKYGKIFTVQISIRFNLSTSSSRTIPSDDLALFLPIARYLNDNPTATPILLLTSTKTSSSIDEKSLYVFAPNNVSTAGNSKQYFFVASSPNKIVDTNTRLDNLTLIFEYNSMTDTIMSASISRSSYDFVSLNSSQTISGIKTFTALPQTSIVPTSNTDMVNKKYVDDQVGNINTILATLTTPGGNS